VDGAFIIIAWVGFKLLLEYLHTIHVVAFEIPKWFSLGLIVVIFGLSYLYARQHERKAAAAQAHGGVDPLGMPGDDRP
jgi:predicted tellurium resistance membrane protein TerC